MIIDLVVYFYYSYRAFSLRYYKRCPIMSGTPILSAAAPILSMDKLYELYPKLEDERNEKWLEILNRAQFMTVSDGSLLAETGSHCANFMLLLDGVVRVYQIDEQGKELTMYRIMPGDVCLMSLNSLIHDRPFRANATAESQINMVMLSSQDFKLAMGVSEAFRMLILSSLVDTVCTMVQSFYDTAFEPLDMRLACLLGQLFERNGTEMLEITHQELSQELGTSREVISRLLKKLEQKESIVLKRGKIMMGKNNIHLSKCI